MFIYALHIKTGRELQIQELIHKKLPEDIKVFCPRRELMIRRKGKTFKQTTPLFSGYLFLEAPEISADTLAILKTITGFFQILPSNKEIKPIPAKDMQFLSSLFNKNYTASLSTARFDENDKIEIISGPLKGKEGLIIKVNKRKGRAKVVIHAFNKDHFVDLGFQVIAPISQAPSV